MRRKKPEEKVEQARTARKAVDKYAALGKEFDAIGWQQASKVIQEVRAVPTIFVGLDAVTGVGGWPTDCVTLIHGPSNQGKSALLLGLLASFLIKGHFAAYIDAEGTTPATWARELIGEQFESPLFRAMYPTTYEGTVDNVRAWAEKVGNLRAQGKVDKDTTGLIGLDSIKKLVPKRLLEKMMKEGAEGPDEDDAKPAKRRKQPGGIDGMGGRAAQYKAALNSAWMDELNLLLRQCGVGMATIGREYANSARNPMSNEPDFILGGGQGLIFDSSFRVRVPTAFQILDSNKNLIGFEHLCEVHKTKVGGKVARIPEARFHTRSGIGGTGFDRARDVFDVGCDSGAIDAAGAHYSFHGEQLGQGKEKAIATLREKAELLTAVEAAIRASFRKPEPAAVVAVPNPESPTAPRAKGKRA